jgi:hypothetical protein
MLSFLSVFRLCDQECGASVSCDMAAAEPDTFNGNTTRRFAIHGIAPPECLADPARVHPARIACAPMGAGDRNGSL